MAVTSGISEGISSISSPETAFCPICLPLPSPSFTPLSCYFISTLPLVWPFLSSLAHFLCTLSLNILSFYNTMPCIRYYLSPAFILLYWTLYQFSEFTLVPDTIDRPNSPKTFSLSIGNNATGKSSTCHTSLTSSGILFFSSDASTTLLQYTFVSYFWMVWAVVCLSMAD